MKKKTITALPVIAFCITEVFLVLRGPQDANGGNGLVNLFNLSGLVFFCYTPYWERGSS